jgi:hypothetical protein
MNPFQAFVLVAGISAAGSLLIVCAALKTLTQISDGGMLAVAAMAFGPALMGIGVSYFISRTAGSRPWDSEGKGARDDDLR